MNFGGDHSAPGHGKISPRCVPERASDKKNASSWQHIACMYSDSANFGKICVPCIRKAPQSAVGEHTARASCRQGAFSPSEALKSCTARKSCHPLMALPLRRTGPEFQNREQVGAEAPAEAVGPAGPTSALPKRPSKGRVPLDRTIGAPPPKKTKPIEQQPQQGLSLLYDRMEQLTSMA